jgi:hypothetical protein
MRYASARFKAPSADRGVLIAALKHHGWTATFESTSASRSNSQYRDVGVLLAADRPASAPERILLPSFRTRKICAGAGSPAGSPCDGVTTSLAPLAPQIEPVAVFVCSLMGEDRAIIQPLDRPDDAPNARAGRG